MCDSSNRINCFFFLTAFLLAILISSCSTINAVPPEINLMRLDVQDVTLSHVNLLADIRIFNPNEKALIIQGMDYTLHLEGIKVFAGKNNMSQKILPHEYGHMTLRLSSAYWDIMQLLNQLSNKSDIAYSMAGSIRAGESRIFAQRFSFAKQGIIPLQKTTP
jgi:LEA14-like dessication related protein